MTSNLINSPINSPTNLRQLMATPQIPQARTRRPPMRAVAFYKKLGSDIKHEKPKQKTEEKPTCPICMDCFCSGKVTTKCGHDICIGCYTTLVRSNDDMPSCPMCRQTMADGVRDIKPPKPEPHPDAWINEWNRAIVEYIQSGDCEFNGQSYTSQYHFISWIDPYQLDGLLQDAIDNISPYFREHDIIYALDIQQHHAPNYEFTEMDNRNELWESDKRDILNILKKNITSRTYHKHSKSTINLSTRGGGGPHAALHPSFYELNPNFIRPKIDEQDYPYWQTLPSNLLTTAEKYAKDTWNQRQRQCRPQEILDSLDNGFVALFEENPDTKKKIYLETIDLIYDANQLDIGYCIENLFQEESEASPCYTPDYDSEDEVLNNMPTLGIECCYYCGTPIGENNTINCQCDRTDPEYELMDEAHWIERFQGISVFGPNSNPFQ